MPYQINDNGEIEDLKGAHKPVFTVVTDEEKSQVKLRGKAVYFIRNKRPGEAISATGQNDSEVLFGEVSEQTITTLNTYINNVYKPMMDRLENNDWGVCEQDARKEYL